jgi:hypothetical protein
VHQCLVVIDQIQVHCWAGLNLHPNPEARSASAVVIWTDPPLSGLVDLPKLLGQFKLNGQKWLNAPTTSNFSIGNLITPLSEMEINM